MSSSGGVRSVLRKPLQEKLEGTWVNLREMREEDTDKVLSFRSDAGKMVLVQVSKETHLGWLREKYQPADNDYYFVIEDRRNAEQVIGTTAICDIDWSRSEGEWGRWVVQQGPCRKYAPLESAVLSVRFGFERLGLQRLLGFVQGSNEKMVNFVARFGFQIDETRRQAYWNDALGAFQDVNAISLTRESFAELAPALDDSIQRIQLPAGR
jgi:RimJ/RimL family protein N-acetyltransferase